MLRRATYEIIEPGVKAGLAASLFQRASIGAILLSVACVVASTVPTLADSLRGLNNIREAARGAFLAVLTREPTQEELDACQETLGDTRNAKALARMLLSTAEFMFQK